MTEPELQDRLRKHVDVLAELIGQRNSEHPTGLDAARSYIERELEAQGHTVERQVHPLKFGRPAVNFEVILKAPAGRSDRPILVVGAHYDSAPGTPGADDNASAVAALLEITRNLAGKSVARDVHLVFYDCEEPPYFGTGQMGSQIHAKSLKTAQKRVFGMICLESIGYYVQKVESSPQIPWILRLLNVLIGGRNVVIVSNLRSIPFGLRFLWAFVRSGLFPFIPAALPQAIGVITLSDHRGYWEQGYRALMVTDTAFLRNPNYHTANDRLATLDLGRMSRLTGQLSKAISKLAGARPVA